MATATYQPKYARLVDDIRSKVESGELKPGDQLPSLTELANSTGCSIGTLRASMLILKSEGIIVGRNGIGVFIAGGAA